MTIEFSQENNDYWTKRSESYGRQHFEELTNQNHTHWEAFFTEILGREHTIKKVLDIGTGPGFLAIILAKLGYSVDAIDLNQSMLEQAKHNADEVGVTIFPKEMSALELSYPDESVDLIVTRNLTWNLEKPTAAYEEWLRVLKKGGLLINIDANWYNYLFNDKEKENYQHDRDAVKEKGLYDFYIHTDISKMEEIARQLPLSPLKRPDWDIETLRHLSPESKIVVYKDINHRVLTEEQEVNFQSTPLFAIVVTK